MGNKLARTACFLAAPALIAAGAGGWAMISKQLSSQRIEVHPDSPIMSGKTVAGPITAFAQASVIEEHAQAMGGGRTFAEISQEWMEAQESGDTARAEQVAGTREVVMQANLLRASLFTSVLAFGVAALAGGMGVLTAVVGSALPKE